MALPIYVINLDRRPDRWQTISDRLDRMGLTAERISAVDANTLAAQGEVNDNSRLRNDHAWGVAACTLSHYKALQTLLDSSAPAALILEDDAEVASDTPALLESKNWWPAATEIIRLEEYAGDRRGRIIRRPSGKTPSGRDVRRLESAIFDSAGYLISRAGSRIVLEASATATISHNILLFDPHFSQTARKLRPAQIVPAMVRQGLSSDANPSDISSWSEELTETHHRNSRRFKLRRKLRLLPYKARSRLLLLTGIVQRIPVSYVDHFDAKQNTL